MKKIIGLDLGTNSVGWAVINANDEGKYLSIEKANSRIIPMTNMRVATLNPLLQNAHHLEESADLLNAFY